MTLATHVLLLARDAEPAAAFGIGAFFCCWFVFVLGMLGFWIWMLVECATKEPNTGNEKIAWILVVALAGAIGALIYYFARRPKRIREHGR
ncbi:MAG: LPXTG cell wall anchor domain-containing protein [Planctomycetes bacterium]|nr:LPXTG cell wall anchor domain-containing protein [Planctomycetota bacterium]